MNRKNFILAILLVYVVILSLNSVFAEEITEDVQLHQTNDIATISQSDDDMLSSQQTITAGSNSSVIQEKINGMHDGDTLSFESGTYNDICIYIDKNITVNGNGAKLVGYDTPSKNNTPELIWGNTSGGGYSIKNFATLYILKTTGVTINGLTIVGGANSSSNYLNTLVYAYQAKNLTFENNTLNGSSWGLYFQFCEDGIVKKNTVKNQAVTGFLNFGSARTLIEQNKVSNAINHGIDVRHSIGPNVKVINNTVIGSKEGIYLMHSKGHTASYNTLINCTISSITCYGSSNINIYNNTMKKSRIGVLLGGGYNNITIGENEFDLDNLPMPPTFVYYVAEAKSDYQDTADIMGTYSDSSSYSPTYTEYSEIKAPAGIGIDYATILEKTGTIYTVPIGTSSAEIQTIIGSMNDKDTLEFEANGIYENISIYTDKNIKIIGNNATLIGYNNISLNYIPEKVRASTNNGGYSVAYRAVLYVLNNTNAVVSNLNIIALYPGYDTTKVTPKTDEYKTSGLYAESTVNLTITGCDIKGASWGIFQQHCNHSIITNNNVHDQYTTGIMNFGSPYSTIAGNIITNAINHGIDVRHGTGPNATIFNNIVSGSKEGIYLMHSRGHAVYNNTILNSKIASITCYGSGNECLFNNTLKGSRIGILLGGGYYNVTIGANTYNLDSLPYPPTFVTYLAKAENKYQSEDNVVRTYSDKETVTIDAADVTVGYKKGTLEITLIDQNNKAIPKQTVIVTINGVNYTTATNANGIATVNLSLTAGTYEAAIRYEGNDNYASASRNASITVKDDRAASALTAVSKTVYLKSIASGYKYTVTLNDANGKVLTNKVITIVFNGKTYKGTTNSEGVATVTLKAISTGFKKAFVTFSGDNANKAVSKITTIKITKEASKITAKKKTFKVKTKNKKYTIVLKSKTGAKIAKAKVAIKVKGKIYYAKTNSKGKATFKINKLTKKGKFEAKITFKGNKYYSKVTKQIKIKTK